jgi:HTH-type transcriptional regulator/antitoxin HigA
MPERVPAEVFPPGEFIREELDARGWTQEDLAKILGTTTARVNEVIGGRRRLTDETAVALGEAFGTGAGFWMNLETAYRLSLLPPKDDGVSRRARLYAKAPIRDLVRRGWIQPSENVAVLEQRVLDFFAISSLDDEPKFAYAAKKATSYSATTTVSQCAWLIRASRLAKGIGAEPFSNAKFAQVLQGLRTLLPNAEDVRKVPKVLADGGIRFLLLEALPGTKIDAACFWLGADAPVVALSLRYDRVDWFWHAVLHELDHVQKKAGMLDTNLVGEEAMPFDDKPPAEREADRFACEYLLSPAQLSSFINRTTPLYSKVRIRQFASVQDVHPGIVVGQLQHRGEIAFSHSREMLVPIKRFIIDSAMTDGWGHTPPSTM